LWRGDLAAQLREALAQAPITDERARDGAERGGRRLAAEVAQRVAQHPAQA
jgi:malonate decarboxylase gamma subunit